MTTKLELRYDGEAVQRRTSTRRFVIGTLDALAAVFVPGLLARLRQRAPGIDLAIREAAPEGGAMTTERADVFG